MDWIKNNKSKAVLIGLSLIFIAIVSSRAFWSTLFAFGALATLGGIIVALVKPTVFSKVFRGNAPRKRVVKYLGLMFIALFIATAIAAPPKDDARSASSTVTTPAPAAAPVAQPIPKTEPVSKPVKPSYEATIFNYTPIDPATLQVVVQIKNTSTIAGTPSCTVQARNESYTYKGFDTFDLDKSVQPGELYTFRGNLTITKEGSVYVTHAEAKCK